MFQSFKKQKLFRLLDQHLPIKEKSDFFFDKNNVCKAAEQEECTLLVNVTDVSVR